MTPSDSASNGGGTSTSSNIGSGSVSVNSCSSVSASGSEAATRAGSPTPVTFKLTDDRGIEHGTTNTTNSGVDAKTDTAHGSPKGARHEKRESFKQLKEHQDRRKSSLTMAPGDELHHSLTHSASTGSLSLPVPPHMAPSMSAPFASFSLPSSAKKSFFVDSPQVCSPSNGVSSASGASALSSPTESRLPSHLADDLSADSFSPSGGSHWTSGLRNSTSLISQFSRPGSLTVGSDGARHSSRASGTVNHSHTQSHAHSLNSLTVGLDSAAASTRTSLAMPSSHATVSDVNASPGTRGRHLLSPLDVKSLSRTDTLDHPSLLVPPSPTDSRMVGRATTELTMPMHQTRTHRTSTDFGNHDQLNHFLHTVGNTPRLQHQQLEPISSPASIASSPAASTGSSRSSQSTESPSQRSASFYHFHTPSAKRRGTLTKPKTLASIVETSPIDGKAAIQRTRTHIRAALSPGGTAAHSRNNSIEHVNETTSPHSASSRSGVPHDTLDDIEEYHRFITEEANKRREARIRAQLQKINMTRRRSSVLPLPAYRADGELETSYIQAQHASVRQRTKVAFVAAGGAVLVMFVPMATHSTFSATENYPILVLRLATVALMTLYSLILHKVPKVFSTPFSLSFSTATVSLLVGVSFIVSTLLVRSESNLSYLTMYGQIMSTMYIICLSMFSFCVLGLPFHYSSVVSCALFVTQTAVQCELQGLTLSVLYGTLFLIFSLLFILYFCYHFETSAKDDLQQKQYLLEERRKAEKLLGSMLPPRILQEYLDGRVGHVSAVATIGFIQVELGQMSNRRGRFHSRSSFHLEEESLSRNVSSSTSSTHSHKEPHSSPTEMIKRLHDTFKRIDAIVKAYESRGVTKIETVSKTYLLCSGLLSDIDDHASATIDVCLEILAMVVNRQSSGPRLPIQLRIGIATGPVVGGIIGSNRRFFRLFGDTVNVSARMCTSAKMGEIMMTSETYRSLSASQRLLYTIDTPKVIQIKGKGGMQVYRLIGCREDWQPKYSKALMARGGVGGSDTDSSGASLSAISLQHHSFVYHNLMQITKISKFNLTYQTPDTAIERCYHRDLLDTAHRDRRWVDVMALAFTLLALVLAIVYEHWSVLIALSIVLAVLIGMIAAFQLTGSDGHLQLVILASLLWGVVYPVALNAVIPLLDPFSPAYVYQFVICFICLSSRIPFRMLVPAQVVAFICFTIMTPIQNAEPSDIGMVCLVLIFTLASGLLVARSKERNQRLNFLLAYALEREQQQMDHFLTNLLPKFVLDVLHKRSSYHTNGVVGTLARQQSVGNNLGNDDTNGNGNGAGGVTRRVSKNATATVAPMPNSPAMDVGVNVKPQPQQLVSSRFAMNWRQCTVFESDIVGYTAMVSQWPALQTLAMLNKVFSRFDQIANQVGVEKIETIGDAFIVVVFEGRPDPVLNFALTVIEALKELNASSGNQTNTVNGGDYTKSPTSTNSMNRLNGHHRHNASHSMPFGSASDAGLIVPMVTDAIAEEDGQPSPSNSNVKVQRQLSQMSWVRNATFNTSAHDTHANGTTCPTSPTQPLSTWQIPPTNDITAHATTDNNSHVTARSTSSESPTGNTARIMRELFPSTASDEQPPPQSNSPPRLAITLPVLADMTSPLSSNLTTPRAPEFHLQIRMGIATGSVCGGIVGNEIPRFALFGAALDTAIAIEQNGRPNEILVSKSTFEECKDRYQFELSDVRAEEQMTYKLNQPILRPSSP